MAQYSYKKHMEIVEENRESIMKEKKAMEELAMKVGLIPLPFFHFGFEEVI